MNFLVNLNLNGNELQNFAVQSLSVDPGELYAGRMWFNSAVSKLKYYNGSSVVALDTFDLS